MPQSWKEESSQLPLASQDGRDDRITSCTRGRRDVPARTGGDSSSTRNFYSVPSSWNKEGGRSGRRLPVARDKGFPPLSCPTGNLGIWAYPRRLTHDASIRATFSSARDAIPLDRRLPTNSDAFHS